MDCSRHFHCRTFTSFDKFGGLTFSNPKAPWIAVAVEESCGDQYRPELYPCGVRYISPAILGPTESTTLCVRAF